jgi:nicotinate-nucleotide adenylyltransferase
MQQIKSLGILGGTFDPIHYGHIVAAECVRDACHLDQIVFVPAARPPHKDLEEVLESQHRYEMVQIALEDNPNFAVSAIELERQGMSYTIETIEAFLRMFPEAEIFFILGVDALLLINTWKEVKHLINLCNFIVVTRPGYILNKKDECFRDIPDSLWDKTRIISIPGLFISSSDIRRRVAQGRTIKYLLPSAVEEYIAEHNLYKDEG